MRAMAVTERTAVTNECKEVERNKGRVVCTPLPQREQSFCATAFLGKVRDLRGVAVSNIKVANVPKQTQTREGH